MIASLMMYARPELEDVQARFWTSIRKSFASREIDAPEHLSQMADVYSVWENPALVLSQTCGMPYRTRLHGHAQIVGTPDYGLEGCEAGYYRSAIIVRADDTREALTDFATARPAFNGPVSQSGFAAMYTHTQASGFWFADRVASGGHLRSAQMVAEGQADIAALDAQTWRLIQRYEPCADKLRVLEYTDPTPGLPYITGPNLNPEIVFDAVSEAIDTLSTSDATALDLRGFISIEAEKYLAVPNPPEAAL